MSNHSHPADCPQWGPFDGCHYTDEDTGKPVPFCDCGSRNPNGSTRRTALVLSPDDNPPF